MIGQKNSNKFHSIIVGGGIAGIESAINLGNQGFKVLMVEKEASIGGNMIALSKVFPTLDCSSCITTPKMSEASKHDNITIMTYAEVKNVEKIGTSFKVLVEQKPRYVNEKTCIGCKLCEEVCPVYVTHEFERELGARKAICIPFTTAIPQKAVLEPKDCIQCGKCYDVCPTEPNSIIFDQEPEIIEFEASSVILASGFKTTPIDIKKEYSDGAKKNIVTAMQFERILAPSGPFGSVLRPFDGKEPENIAFVLCAGSRDRSIGVPYCSRVCCMYSIKQAMLLSGALPLADITIYYMDIRAFGKGYEQFYQNAKAMGVIFVKAKVARMTEKEDGDIDLSIEALEDNAQRITVSHDLVVTASGIQAETDPSKIAPVDVDEYGFIKQEKPKYDPVVTKTDGIFLAGTTAGPKDIVDTIYEAGSAAMKCANYINTVSSFKSQDSSKDEGGK